MYVFLLTVKELYRSNITTDTLRLVRSSLFQQHHTYVRVQPKTERQMGSPSLLPSGVAVHHNVQDPDEDVDGVQVDSNGSEAGGWSRWGGAS